VKKWIRKWLDIDNDRFLVDHLNNLVGRALRDITGLQRQSLMITDVRVKTPTVIVIATRFNQGRAIVIEANFSGLKEVNEFITHCQQHYGIKYSYTDVPRDNTNLRY